MAESRSHMMSQCDQLPIRVVRYRNLKGFLKIESQKKKVAGSAQKLAPPPALHPNNPLQSAGQTTTEGEETCPSLYRVSVGQV